MSANTLPLQLSQLVFPSDVRVDLFKSAAGITMCFGPTVPTDADTGFAPGCVFIHNDNTTAGQFIYINEGTKASCDFNALFKVGTGSTLTQTYSTAEATHAARTAVALTGTLTGTVDGALADVADIALSTSDMYTDAAVNGAVNTAIASVNLQLKELQTTLNALIVDVADTAAFLNSLVDSLQASKIVG